MKVSIITVAYNSAKTIRNAIDSVMAQTYADIEHLVIDGASQDGTVEIINRYGDHVSQFVSEPDRGIYDAMNKGLKLATGDIVGFLNSDDFYHADNVIATIAAAFMADQALDVVFGDLVYVNPTNLNQIVRYYSSAYFHPDRLAYGWMPAHPTVFIRRPIYEKYGVFKTDYQIASDYELMVRLLARHRLTYRYIPRIMVTMRNGGVSTASFKSNWILNREIIRGCRENNISTNFLKVYSKYLTKIWQLVQRPKEMNS
ncbi:MAG: glycosyltransferase family 2 protein [Cyanobacteria bacterium P01_C01_bin.70]